MKTALLAAAFAFVAPIAHAGAPLLGLALDGLPITSAQLSATLRDTGFSPQLVVFFQQWPEDTSARQFPADSLAAIRSAGAVPVVTWEPMYYRADSTEVIIPLARILAGDYDGYIDDYAARAAAHPGPVILRFAHEMNLSRYHWGIADKSAYGPASPGIYQQLWRHVVARFRAARADNVLFAFCPNNESLPGALTTGTDRWNRMAAYYPGDEWVDLVGLDGYNWGDTQTPAKHGWQSQWRTFAHLFSPALAELRAFAPAKPVVIFETASAPTGGDKARWIAEMLRFASAENLGGVVWFQVNKEIDWRIRTGVPPYQLPSVTPADAEAAVRSWKP